jgi:hypothetical protein
MALTAQIDALAAHVAALGYQVELDVDGYSFQILGFGGPQVFLVLDNPTRTDWRVVTDDVRLEVHSDDNTAADLLTRYLERQLFHRMHLP